MSEREKKHHDDDKIHVTQSVFETSKEMRRKAEEEEQKRQAELDRKSELERRKADEERDKRLADERRELMRMKQGIIEESDKLNFEEEAPVERTFFQKVSSFFYLNKWWLGLCTAFGILAIFLVYNFLSKPRPDIEVLLIGENYSLGYESELESYVEEFTGDFNGNGEILAMINYIPFSENPQNDLTGSVQTKLAAVLQSNESVIIIGNQEAAKVMSEEGFFTDLTDLYPENEHISGSKFMLSGTDFAKKVGIDDKYITEDWFIAIRNPAKRALTKEDKIQKIYDRDFAVFDSIIKDLS